MLYPELTFLKNKYFIDIEVTNKAMVKQKVIGYLINVITKL